MKEIRYPLLFVLFLLVALLLNACNLPAAPTVVPSDVLDAPINTVEPEQPLEAPDFSEEPAQAEVPDNITTQGIDIPGTFTIPAGQHIKNYDAPGGESKSTFEIELTFTVIEERDGFLRVSWDSSSGTYEGWIKRQDVAIFLTGEYDECPFTFNPSDYTPKTFSPPDGSQPKGIFTAGVLIDLSSEPVSIEQAEATLRDASGILSRLTGFVIQMVSYESVEIKQAQDTNYLDRDNIPECYIAEKIDIPDSIIVFTYGSEDRARIMGGYSFSIEGPPTFNNHFIDPYGAENLVYLMFDHYNHMYARCGYDESGDALISNTSIGGECRNQPGTACVMKNGYSMCETAVNDLYASTPNYFSASTVIHEIMHSFGINGNLDHFGSPDCTDEMKKKDSTWVPIDDEAEKYNVMCPYVYDNFVNGYRP